MVIEDIAAPSLEMENKSCEISTSQEISGVNLYNLRFTGTKIIGWQDLSHPLQFRKRISGPWNYWTHQRSYQRLLRTRVLSLLKTLQANRSTICWRKNKRRSKDTAAVQSSDLLNQKACTIVDDPLWHDKDHRKENWEREGNYPTSLLRVPCCAAD